MNTKFLTDVVKHLAACCALLVCLAYSTAATAATILLDNLDGANEGFNDNSPAFPNQTNNPGTTLGEQRLAVFRAAAGFWGARLQSDVPIIVSINMDPLSCNASSATLGSAGAEDLMVNFQNAPLADIVYPIALANSIAGEDLTPGAGSGNNDIRARFNVDIDNNSNCLPGNWWYGIDSPPPQGTFSLFDTVLHEIGHGLGVSSAVNASTGARIGSGSSFRPEGFDDIYSFHLFDAETNRSWRDMSNAERRASAINTGNLVWNGNNANNNSDHLSPGSRVGERIRMFAPNPLQGGSSVSHWDTALSPNELMEPSLTFEPDSRSTFQLLRDIGWNIVTGELPPQPGQISFTASTFSVVENEGPAQLTLIRSGGTDGAVSVRVRSEDISANGLGTDYNSVNQVVNWADGETGIQTVSVTVVDDGLDESNETARFNLSNATGGVTIAQASTTLTIRDPAPITPSTLTFSGRPFEVAESTGTIVIQVRRSGSSIGAVSVTANSDNITALGNGVDYSSIINRTLNWANGELGTRQFTIDVTQDTIDEPNEQFQISLTNVVGNALLATNSSTAVITILDSNSSPEPDPEPTPTPTPDTSEDNFLLDIIVPILGAISRNRNT